MRTLLLLLLCITTQILQGQDSDTTEEIQYTYATFKGTRLVNFHTIETLKKGSLEFRIAHRFGMLSSGLSNFYGIDGPASIQLRLDYAITDRLMIGVGRGSDRKLVDAFVKFKWLRQTWENEMPLSLTLLTSANVFTERNTLNRYDYFSSRMAYFSSVMIARKFNTKFSVQLSPMFVHYNLVEKLDDKNDMLFFTGQARYKFTGSTALTAEYSFSALSYTRDMEPFKNVLSIGFDIETGGHVFQVFLSNGFAINEVLTLPYTTGSWSNNEMRVGFNISRVFGFEKDESW